MVAELGRFLRGEILFLVCVQVFFHLLHDMLGLMKVLNIQYTGERATSMAWPHCGQSFHFWKRSTYENVLHEGHRIMRYIPKR